MDWMDKNTIVVFDHYSPRILTLDPWPQLIFIGATGQKTIWEYVFLWQENMKVIFRISWMIPLLMRLNLLDYAL